jgi:hypothetical protein
MFHACHAAFMHAEAEVAAAAEQLQAAAARRTMLLSAP